MKNIFQIFYHDIKKIRKNVIALIVILGITIVPSLYAWFNIAASWDPYGNTGDLKVAIASQDKGYDGELIPVKLNLGDQILSELHENTQLNWVFTNAKDAKKGVKSGRYYAALVIPKDFSQDMMSLFSPDVTHPKLLTIQRKRKCNCSKDNRQGGNGCTTTGKQYLYRDYF